ncbi:MAG: SCO family protein [Betaproteobacteria bacterium]|nr:SCO family protein [Betaproteobacteria bacterium]
MRALLSRHLATLVAALVVAASLNANAATPFNGVDISHAKSYAQDFRLTDHDGRTRTLADFRGKTVVLFFGYLQCPNYCPVTLARLAETMQLLGEDAKRVQVLFVTLDPERDLPPALKEYVTNFNPTFLGLYAAPAATADLALKFRVYYEKRPGPTATSYSIDHAVFSYAYDPQGRLRLLLKDSLTAAELASDLRRLSRTP